MIIAETSHTLLFVGPMSANFIEVAAKYSHEKGIVLPLIASRRQIEAKVLGGGYVENWSTEDFVKHIEIMRKKYPKAHMPICRDHGGPWQGTNESKLSYDEAMVSAKTSFETDIKSGFDVIHIDTSKNITKNITLSLKLALDLLLFCEEKAKEHGKKLIYEVGAEDADGGIDYPIEFENILIQIEDFTKSYGIPKPMFVVGRTGTLVKETRQVGKLDPDNTKKLLEISKKFGMQLKEHNADYDTAENLQLRNKIGLTAMNVAPEFGVIETQAFIELCKTRGREDIFNKFIDLAYESKKWDKWMITPDRSKFDKAIIAGHYVFGTPEFKKLKVELGADVDSILQKALWDKIDWYIENLGGKK